MGLTGAAPAKPACGPCGDMSGFLAVSEDEPAADAAIAALRERGPAGLDALVAAWSDAIERYRALAATGSAELSEPSWARLAHALDRVGAQRDNWAAQLYWYTDLDKALAASKETGRPWSVSARGSVGAE